MDSLPRACRLMLDDRGIKMALKKGFGDGAFLRGWYDVRNDGNRITLPYEYRSAIATICDGQKALLRFCPIDYGANEVTLHVSLPEETESPCVIRYMDARGRIRLPTPLSSLLREEAAKTVKLVPMPGHFEIFSPVRLEECQSQLEEDYPVDRAALAELFPEKD